MEVAWDPVVCFVPAPLSLQQMMRLKRELDRVTEERDRARDSGKRAEQARQQLEVELKVRGQAKGRQHLWLVPSSMCLLWYYLSPQRVV